MTAEFEPSTIKFNADGLVPAIAQDQATGMVLMLAWMNEEALLTTLRSGHVTYWSRSRGELWEKGATSGHRQKLVSMRIDCDRDCLLMMVKQIGPACHTNRKSCFYTDITDGSETILMSPSSQPD